MRLVLNKNKTLSFKFRSLSQLRPRPEMCESSHELWCRPKNQTLLCLETKIWFDHWCAVDFMADIECFYWNQLSILSILKMLLFWKLKERSLEKIWTSISPFPDLLYKTPFEIWSFSVFSQSILFPNSRETMRSLCFDHICVCFCSARALC